MLYKTYLYNFNVTYRYKIIWTVNFSMICLSTGQRRWAALYGGIRTLLFLWWTIIVEPVLKETCTEIPPVYKDHLEILWISSLYPQSTYMYFCGLCCLKKDVISYSKNIFDVKKGEAKKEQVTEWFKDVKSLSGQEEKIPARLCRTPAYKASLVSTLFFNT